MRHRTPSISADAPWNRWPQSGYSHSRCCVRSLNMRHSYHEPLDGYWKGQQTRKNAPGPVAQRLEQATHNRLVGGSNPSGPIPSTGPSRHASACCCFDPQIVLSAWPPSPPLRVGAPARCRPPHRIPHRLFTVTNRHDSLNNSHRARYKDVPKISARSSAG